MLCGEYFETVDAFIRCLKEYIYCCNNERILSKLKMSPAQCRTHSQLMLFVQFFGTPTVLLADDLVRCTAGMFSGQNGSTGRL